MKRKLYPLPNGETGFVQREFSLSGRGGWLWGYCDPSEGTSDTIGIADTMGAAAIELLKFAAESPVCVAARNRMRRDYVCPYCGQPEDLNEPVGSDRRQCRCEIDWSDECAFCGAAGARLAATDDPRTVGDDPLCDRCRDALELDPD